MASDLQHEDLLIKLRAKLNEEKIKLWESPYYGQTSDGKITKELEELAQKYAHTLSMECSTVLQALVDLQSHSLERVKANEEFKESGVATLRVKATIPGQKPRQFNVQKKLSVPGAEVITAVGTEIGAAESRVKLIYNGRVMKPSLPLQEQGIKNGVQIMALVMAETPEEIKQEDDMYMEMKSTRDDAMLLSEYAGDLAEDEYMKLEDQSGKAIQLPCHERRALMVGLALHERGRTAVMQENYPLALVLLLEADRQLSECNSSVLESVDNWALLQLDIAWCYLCLQSITSAADAFQRLTKAEQSFHRTYGPNMERLMAIKGNAANERVLLMRLYLLQGIVAYHQNRRLDARKLLDKAEVELNTLRVDDKGVAALMELGWSQAQARCGLRATAGDVDRAHHYLDELRRTKEEERIKHKETRKGSNVPVSERNISVLLEMGFSRRAAVLALRASSDDVAEAARIIHDRPEMMAESSGSSLETSASEESLIEPDEKLVTELIAMGYEARQVLAALRHAYNDAEAATEMLLSGKIPEDATEDPSTSSKCTSCKDKKQVRMEKQQRKKAREQALHRLSSAIRTDEDDHYDTSLQQEEQFLVQYKSLL
ncbi:NEDD8 ultimate buster 1 [Eumeta japonica]|uniref:NEDD8 ultimate buster 1 n=1 Tax=Eumeta variegata TaxID=151549 RepID=A0A4C1VXN7_EUMVA|nr:NEDD8 ultimate buster 1 [Eumeta japonica]